MPEITATDVKALREATGAGIMDAKRALTETGNDPAEAAKWLRERGLGKAAERADRENTEGAVAVASNDSGSIVALVELKSETDFVAKSPQFVNLADQIAQAVVHGGEGAADEKRDAVDDLKVTLKENIELGRVVRFEAEPGNVLDAYLHIQNGRGVNGVVVELSGGSAELTHDIAVHIAFGRPAFLDRSEVPTSAIEEERALFEAAARNEGKPEAALAKIVEGRLNGWYKRVPGGVLVEQPYAKDDKKTVSSVLGDASVVRFAQVTIGA
ncbi:MAG: translation elongation factor Ts [Acidimicrobiales bacterium]